MTSNSGRGGHCERCGCACNNHTFGICGGGSGKGSKYVACTFEWSRCTTGGHNDVTELQYIDCKRCPSHPGAPPSNGEFWGSQPDDEYQIYTADQLGIPWPEPEDKPHGAKDKGKDKGEANKKEKRDDKGGEADSYWTLSDEYNKYYHMHEDGSCEWYNEEEASSSAAAPKSSRGKGKGKRK